MLALVVLGAFTLQAGALGRAGRGEVAVVRTLAALQQYDGSVALIDLGALRETAVCNQLWHRQGRGETVTVGRRVVARKVDDVLRPRTKLALDQFELAGCPRVLTEWLTTNINEGNRLLLLHTHAFGARLEKVRVLGGALGLAVFVRPTNGVPVALTISGGGLRGWSRLLFTPRPSALVQPPTRPQTGFGGLTVAPRGGGGTSARGA